MTQDRELKFRLIKDNEIVGYETHMIDPDIGHVGIYHKDATSDMLAGYPVTYGDKYYIFHDAKEQYTCIKDKHNREIYEGDFIREYATSQILIKYTKMYNCGCCWDDAGIGFNFLQADMDDLEVIGNIHDNIDLLEKERAK